MELPVELSDLQIAVMRVLWNRGQAAAVDVHKALLADRKLAFTTISTMLTRLEKRGLVTHRTEGRQFIYRAMITESDVLRSDMNALMDRWFSGSAPVLVNHLLNTSEIADEDLSKIKTLIEAAEKRETDQ